MKFYIRALAHYVPDGILRNALFESRLATSDSWITSRTGIRERRYLSDYEGDSPGFELVRRAYRALESDPGFDRDRVDFVISASSHHDAAYPNAANRLVAELGVARPSFQLQAACSSVAYAIGVARGLLLASPMMQDVLIVCGEAFTRYVDYGDRSSAVLFGDAGCALVISRDGGTGSFELVDLELGGDGSSIVNSSRESATSQMSVHEFVAGQGSTPKTNVGGKFQQDGRAVVEYVRRVIPPAIQQLLSRSGIATHEIDTIITHQANLRLMEAIVDAAGFPKTAHRFVVDRYGNTSSAGWVLTLSEERARIAPAERVLVAAFGAGMTWATLLLRAT